MSDSDRIEPRKVALGGIAEPRRTFDLKYVWMLAAVAVVSLLLVIVILSAPERPAPIKVNEPPKPTVEASSPARMNIPTPLEMERKKRALEEANAIVKRFTELEIELEDSWNVAAWGETGYSDAREAAAQAESAFADGAYDEALAGYSRGVQQLEGMLDQARDEYQAAIGRAIEALDRRDHRTASESIQAASAYQPESALLEASRKRLQRLDELEALLERAGRAEAGGNLDGAIRLLLDARGVDPDTQGIDTNLARLRRMRADAEFRTTLARGYDALDSEDFSTAEDAFTAALGMKPNNPGARQGLEQTRFTRVNLQIQAALTEAQGFEDDEDWTSAINAFERALELDQNLSEGNAGLQRARSRHALDQALAAMIADAGQLADGRKFAQAQNLLQSAQALKAGDGRLQSQIVALANQIDNASIPAVLTLISDAETDVRLQFHGYLGRFKTRTLQTRPGRYLVRGGRDGFREVRFEVTLKPGPQSIQIICSEPIH